MGKRFKANRPQTPGEHTTANPDYRDAVAHPDEDSYPLAQLPAGEQLSEPAGGHLRVIGSTVYSEHHKPGDERDNPEQYASYPLSEQPVYEARDLDSRTAETAYATKDNIVRE